MRSNTRCEGPICPARAHDQHSAAGGFSSFAPHPLEDDAALRGEPRELFAAAAVRVGLTGQYKLIKQNLVAFTCEVMEQLRLA